MTALRAAMRVNGADEVRLKIVHTAPPIIVVDVPGFGHLVVGEHPEQGWKAELQPYRTKADELRVLTAPVGERLFPPSRTPTVRLEGDRVVVEMLHKGDRLDVVIDGLKA